MNFYQVEMTLRLMPSAIILEVIGTAYDVMDSVLMISMVTLNCIHQIGSHIGALNALVAMKETGRTHSYLCIESKARTNIG